MKSFNLTEWALDHRATVLFLILAIMIGGVLGFNKLGQLEDPKFSVPSMTVMVVWPGATAQQVQDEVLNRMEKKFEQLDHFDKVKTYARQGYAGMLISVKGGTSHADQREAWYQARKKFSDLELELPDGVIGPIFNDEFGDVTGLLYAVKGDGIGQWELSDAAEDIKRNWYALRDNDDGCTHAASQLYANKKLSALDVWRKARFAVDANRPRVVRTAGEIVAPDAVARVTELLDAPS